MIGHPDDPLAAGWRGLPAGGRVAGVGMGDQAVLSGREPGRFEETVRAGVPLLRPRRGDVASAYPAVYAEELYAVGCVVGQPR